MRKFMISVAACSLALGGAAFAHDTTVMSGDEATDGVITMPDRNKSYSTWDSDKDGSLDFTEWVTGDDEYDRFGAMDTNNDGVVSKEEYSRSYWQVYDRDRDGAMSKEEYGRYYSDQQYMMPGNRTTREGS
jgi:Ca2+-binding EF-hand superfamily protein